MIRDPRMVFDQLFGVGTIGANSGRSAAGGSQHSRLGQACEMGRLKRRSVPPIARDLTITRETSARSNAASQKIEGLNKSGEARDLPLAPIGVPTVRRARQADVRFADHRLRRQHHARLGDQNESRRVGPDYPESGVKTGFHSASHHGTTRRGWCRYAKINTYHVSLLPYFLEKLKKMPMATEPAR